MTEFTPLIEKNSCYKCTHYFVCHMLEIVRNTNCLNRPPYKTLFFSVPENIGAVCQYRKEKKEKSND